MGSEAVNTPTEVQARFIEKIVVEVVAAFFFF